MHEEGAADFRERSLRLEANTLPYRAESISQLLERRAPIPLLETFPREPIREGRPLGEVRKAADRLVREIVEWRITDYLDRGRAGEVKLTRIVCEVSHAGGRPLIFLDRERNLDLPIGWTEIRVDGELYLGNFVRAALNVVRREGSAENRLPSLLRGC
jgi:hypothetical protein